MSVIKVEAIGKAYKQYSNRWGRLLEWLPFSSAVHHQLKWALRDVSFSVGAGEAVGIVGLNGAGKSTLLKILSGTTRPSTGEMSVAGRVSALLELGMGFHPDFTGRQNVLMSGLLSGIAQEELYRLMPAIEAFAEIGDYFDRPLRVYSSGMQMRLAFSVATIKRPDVLIIDEALSVGDAYFQHKSFDRIRELRTQGTTLLFVSHDKGAIQSICDRVLLLEQGAVAMVGGPEQVMDFYNARIAERENQTVRQERNEQGQVQTISGTGEARLVDFSLLNEAGERIEVAHIGQRLVLSVTAEVFQDLPELVLGYVIKDRLGQSIFGTNTHRLKEDLKDLRKGETVQFTFDFILNLGEGNYSIALALHTADTHLANNFEWRDLALVFNVVNLHQQPFVGVAWLPPTLRCQRNG